MFHKGIYRTLSNFRFLPEFRGIYALPTPKGSVYSAIIRSLFLGEIPVFAGFRVYCGRAQLAAKIRIADGNRGQNRRQR